MLRVKLWGVRLEWRWHYFLILAMILLVPDVFFLSSCLIFSFFHELAHFFTAKLLGYESERILLGVFGGNLCLKETSIKPFSHVLIHLSGPLFNLSIAALTLILLSLLPPSSDEELKKVLMTWVIWPNLLLGLFNLLPIYPLDGGRIMNLYLSFFLGFGRAVKISRLFSGLFAVFLFLFGISLLQYNLLNLLLPALAFHLLLVGGQEQQFLLYRVARSIEDRKPSQRETLELTQFNVSAWELLKKHRSGQNRWFAIINDQGHYQGQLTESDLLAGVFACGIDSDCRCLLEYYKNNTTDYCRNRETT